ncbi:MAG: hypothetical protein CME19_14405 [Gemmatimonadetes bacterium]|nr:hypothetical protein [Gemmatimonadota bacterium]
MSPSFYGRYHGEQFDKAQPIRGEHYDFYHELAFDFLLFTPDDQFRVLDLGCGTANFLIHILQTFWESTALTYDFSSEMVEYAARKPRAWKDEFKQRNLHDGIPDEIGSFDLVTSFSAIHHLKDKAKRRMYDQIHAHLNPNGWFFLLDAMVTRFDNEMFSWGRPKTQADGKSDARAPNWARRISS